MSKKGKAKPTRILGACEHHALGVMCDYWGRMRCGGIACRKIIIMDHAKEADRDG